jgi:hypothetical protein
MILRTEANDFKLLKINFAHADWSFMVVCLLVYYYGCQLIEW